MIECLAEEMGDLKAKSSWEVQMDRAAQASKLVAKLDSAKIVRLAQLEVKLETEAAQMVHFQDKYMAMDTLLEKDLQTMDKS